MNRLLKAIPFDGLNTECLGNYLTGLGVLAAVSQRWPTMRACWRNGRFVLLTDDPSVDAVAVKMYLLNKWQPTEYERWWTDIQKLDTKGKVSSGIWRERSQRSLAEVRVLDAHIVGTGRNRFNPVLGTGGNVGKRDLAKACRDATKLIAKPEKGLWLEATLSGRPVAPLPELRTYPKTFAWRNV